MTEKIKEKTSRILRQPEVTQRTGRSRAAIYAGMDAGDFPRCVKIGERAVGWLEADIDAWIEGRLIARRHV